MKYIMLTLEVVDSDKHTIRQIQKHVDYELATLTQAGATQYLTLEFTSMLDQFKLANPDEKL